MVGRTPWLIWNTWFNTWNIIFCSEHIQVTRWVFEEHALCKLTHSIDGGLTQHSQLRAVHIQDAVQLMRRDLEGF